MSQKIKDVTSINPNAAFRSDIQISHFRTSSNLDLVETFMFTAGNFREKKSSSELLEKLRDTTLSQSTENRFLVRANFGHGKSHFALAVANFFGKPTDSNEVNALFSSLDHALKDPVLLEQFRSYKNQVKPHLVVLLRGDMPGDLHDKFFNGLYEALQDHESTKNIQPPFWFEKAEQFLSGIKEDNIEKADQFLEARNQDLPGLRKHVKEHKTGTFELCRQLCHHIKDVWPDWNRETSLTDALNWAVQELCDVNGPLGGVLVLFDEFSVFARDYVATQATGVPLQELLNGVEQNRGKVVFVAFAQHEPEVVARGDGTAEYENLLKELTRLPKGNRFVLQTSLEDVLRAYFKPNLETWQTMLTTVGIANQVGNASDIAFECFGLTYEKSLGWGAELFQENIARGCFPLHPLTTTLLASVELESVTNRSVLNFLKAPDGPLQKAFDYPAVADGKLNWVLPISLVDYFGKDLSIKAWSQFDALNLSDLTEPQKKVLKAMMLQTAANISSRSVGYANLIGQLCGLSEEEASATLKGLDAARYIRYDAGNKTYSFWSGSNDAMELERLIADERESLDKHDRDFILDSFYEEGTNKVNEINQDALSTIGYRYPVPVSWGHQDDWAAREIYATRAGCEIEVLNRIMKRYQATTKKVPDCRGIVVVFLASKPEDVDWIDNQLEKILNSSTELSTAPIIYLCPKRESPELVENLIKYSLLLDKKFVDKARPQIGITSFEEEKNRYAKQIAQGLDTLRKNSRYVVGTEIRGNLRALSIPNGAADGIQRRLKEVYKIAYHKKCARFYDQYRLNNAQLRNAVADLIPILISNNIASTYDGLSVIPSQIVDNFLKSPSAWGLLNPNLSLQPPSSPETINGWDVIENNLPANESTVAFSPAIQKGLNVPYGYDVNTMTLLMASWLGIHRLEISLFHNNRQVSISDLISNGTAKGKLKPKDFLDRLCNFSLRRKNREKELARVKEVIEHTEKGWGNRTDAEDALAILRGIIDGDQISDPTLTGNIEITIEKIEKGLIHQEEYDKTAEKIIRIAETASDIDLLVKQILAIENLTVPNVVAAKEPDLTGLRNAILEGIRKITVDYCFKYKKLSKITDYGKNEAVLGKIERLLDKHGLVEYQNLIKNALQDLEKEKKRLEYQATAENDLRIIENLDSHGSLMKLRFNEDKLKSYLLHPDSDVSLAASRQLVKVTLSIEELEQIVRELPTDLEKISSSKELRKLKDKILINQNQFEGSKELLTVESSLQHIESLNKFFSVIERTKPKTQEDFDTLFSNFDTIRDSVVHCLSADQQELAEKYRQEMETYRIEQESEAIFWLDEKKLQLNAGGDPDHISKALHSPPSFFPENKKNELEMLIERCNELFATRAQEKQIVHVIDNTPTIGKLSELRLYFEGISQYVIGDSAIGKKASAKQIDIKKEIDRLEEQVKSWSNHVETITTGTVLHDFTNRLQRTAYLYEGTDLSNSIELILDKCSKLADIFNRVEKQYKITTKSVAENLVSEFTEILELPFLSISQRAVVGNVIGTIKKHIEKNDKKTIEWLTAIDADLKKNNANLEIIYNKLQAPLHFMNDDGLALHQRLCDDVLIARNREKNDSQIRQQLGGFQNVQALKTMRDQLDLIRKLSTTVFSDELRLDINRKGKALSLKIETLEEKLKDCTIRLEETSGLKDVQILLNELTESSALYRETNEESQLTSLIGRTKELLSYFTSLEELINTSFDSPVKAKSILSSISQLSNTVVCELSDVHKKAILDAENSIKNKILDKVNEARKKLKSLTEKFNAEKDFDVIDRELRQPPSFLNIADRKLWQQLRTEFDHKMDLDSVGKIVMEFKKIKDHTKRAECLARLNSLIYEEIS